ncbi:MAG: hypothetical protein AB1488_04415 [Nitrospirota bacterium]
MLQYESTYIPISTRHRIENPGIIPLHIIDVQNGDYFGNDSYCFLIDRAPTVMVS